MNRSEPMTNAALQDAIVQTFAMALRVQDPNMPMHGMVWGHLESLLQVQKHRAARVIFGVEPGSSETVQS